MRMALWLVLKGVILYVIDEIVVAGYDNLMLVW
jgi:hypothetical protein